MEITLDRMAKPKKPPTEPVRIWEELARMLTVISAAQGKSVPDFFGETFADQIRELYLATGERISRERPKKKPS